MRIAKLNTVDLPPQFSYKPYIPKKRNTITPTASAVVTQHASPQIVHGDGTISWTIEACYPTEFQALWELYNTDTPEEYSFEGYWGEVLQVYFTSLDEPEVRGSLFKVSGQFQVLGITTGYNAECN
jgi:hypothetical protein